MSHRVLLYDVCSQSSSVIPRTIGENFRQNLKVRLAVQSWIRWSSIDILLAYPYKKKENYLPLENSLHLAYRVDRFLQIQSLFADAGTGTLKLSQLQLETIPHIFHFPIFQHHLYSLDLSHNRLEFSRFYSFLSTHSLYKLSSLTQLDLSNNQITHIPHKIAHLKQLKHLNINMNGLKKLPRCIGELNQLQYLNLSHNPLVILPTTLLKLPISCVIDITHTVKWPKLQQTLSRVMSSPEYTGPRFVGIQTVDPLLPLSNQQIKMEWQCTYDLLKWRNKAIHEDQQALDQVVEKVMSFVHNPQQIELDLFSLIEPNISIPPIFGEPFASRLEILRLSHDHQSMIFEKINNLKALKKLCFVCIRKKTQNLEKMQSVSK